VSFIEVTCTDCIDLQLCFVCCVVQVFRACDQDGDGVISGPELLSLMQGARGWSELDGVMEGESVADTLPSMLRHADTNGDGQICFDEFLALLQVCGWRGGGCVCLGGGGSRFGMCVCEGGGGEGVNPRTQVCGWGCVGTGKSGCYV
jgi:hypothetical protein